MAALAIIGSALASALLSRVFGKILDGDDQKQTACAKEPFQVAVDQATVKAKGEDVVKTGSDVALPAAPKIEEIDKTEGTSGMPALAALFDSQFNRSRVSQPAGSDFGFPVDAPTTVAGFASAPLRSVPEVHSDAKPAALPSVAAATRKPPVPPVKPTGPDLAITSTKARNAVAEAHAPSASATRSDNDATTPQAVVNKDSKVSPEELVNYLGGHENLPAANNAAARRASKLMTSYAADPASSASGASVSTTA